MQKETPTSLGNLVANLVDHNTLNSSILYFFERKNLLKKLRSDE